MKDNRVPRQLYTSLWLHETTYDAKKTNWHSVFCHVPGDDGVIRVLAGTDASRVRCIEREIISSVGLCGGGARHHQAAAKTHVVALDQRNHIAFSI